MSKHNLKAISIYVDTSIKGPKRKGGACLYILAFQSAGGKTADAGGWIRQDDATENQLALLGLEAALRRLKEPCCLRLYLECRYVASALQNRWYEKWAKNDWKNAKGSPVAAAGTWQSIEYAKAHRTPAKTKANTQRERERRSEHKERGLCVWCSNPAVNGCLCDKCRISKKRSNIRRMQKQN